jgi:hypothetical protein
MLYVPRVPQDDPASWRLEISQDRIDLYAELLERTVGRSLHLGSVPEFQR